MIHPLFRSAASRAEPCPAALHSDGWRRHELTARRRSTSWQGLHHPVSAVAPPTLFVPAPATPTRQGLLCGNSCRAPVHARAVFADDDARKVILRRGVGGRLAGRVV